MVALEVIDQLDTAAVRARADEMDARLSGRDWKATFLSLAILLPFLLGRLIGTTARWIRAAALWTAAAAAQGYSEGYRPARGDDGAT